MHFPTFLLIITMFIRFMVLETSKQGNRMLFPKYNTTCNIIFKITQIPRFMTSIKTINTSRVFTTFITKTLLYNFDSLKPNFHIVKLGYTLFFLFLLKRVPTINVLNRNTKKKIRIIIWKFSVFGVEILHVYLNMFVFVMVHDHSVTVR